MPVAITILTIPLGSQLVSTIASDEPETKNDFRVLILLDANGTGLEESDITLSDRCEPCGTDGCQLGAGKRRSAHL